MSELSRRQFLKYAAVGVTGVAVGGVALSRYSPLFRQPRPGGEYKLNITEALVEMVDRTAVYHWAFEDLKQLKPVPQMPGPLIDAMAGEQLMVTIVNSLPQVHGFRIPGVAGEVGMGVEILPGETKTFSFIAPPAGSYLYFDHLNAPVNRVMGLHGPLVVLPKQGNTPYSYPTPAVQKLFDDLGTTAHFPGEAWRPERMRVWLINSIDPTFNEMAEMGQEISAASFKDSFLPRYFTIDGLSGAFASHSHDVMPSGRIGQPLLIRIMNAGMAAHSLHIHVNHVYVTSKVDIYGINKVQENVVLVDTMTAKPEERMDWLLPFVRPPDVPGDPSKPLREILRDELALTLGGVGQSPLAMPMHCHMEMSQTAAGGNYPQGLVTHWEITGDLDGIDFPPSSSNEAGGPSEKH